MWISCVLVSLAKVFCLCAGCASSFQRLQEGQGNVHSGATPPWLMTDSCDDDDDGGGDDVSKEAGGAAAVLIGPSEEEFLRHSERQSFKSI